MKRINFNFKDKKMLYAVLCVLIVSIFTLTMAYAALSVTLNISGSAQVNATDWNIYFANPVVKSGSVSTTVPTITSGNSLSFSAELTTPGDFYEFTVDVVNDGGIDAMIDSITKTPELTEAQAKYLTYEISYQNGESITSKQNLAAGSTTPLKVKVAYRTDLSASDLPTTADTLSLSITVNYVQSDGTGSDVKDNGVLKLATADGDINAIGTVVTIGDQQFYTIGTEGDNVKLLSMYNLHVGNTYDSTNGVVALSNPTGIQDASAKGWFSGYSVDNPIIGNVAFSSTNYWSSTVSTYPAYVYNSSSTLYTYIENYKSYIEGLGVEVSEARPITYEELTSEEIGCSADDYSCTTSSYPWIYSTSYWSGSASATYDVWGVSSYGSFGCSFYSDADYGGVRPVIIISKSVF